MFPPEDLERGRERSSSLLEPEYVSEVDWEESGVAKRIVRIFKTGSIPSILLDRFFLRLLLP